MTHQWMRYGMVIVILLWLQALPVSAGIYSWTDENGVKHFSNEAPPSGETVKRQEELKYDDSQYKKWKEERLNKQTKMLEGDRSQTDGTKKTSAPQAKATRHPGNVVMYVTPTCGYCRRAKSFFNKHKIAFAEYDITTDKHAAQRFKALKGSGVPLILVGERRIPGFNKPLLRKLFGIEKAKP